MKPFSLWLWLVLGAVVPAARAAEVTFLAENSDPVGLYHKFELTFALSTVHDNPFDPDQVDICVDFTAPSGKTRTVVAFWAGEPFPPQPTADWHARFAPEEAGLHQYTIRVDDASGGTIHGPHSFTAAAAERRGFVRLDPYHRTTLRHSTGEPFHPTGHNLAWPEAGGVDDYVRWFDKFRANGLNWSRIWMNPYSGQGLEWLDDGTGRYHGLGRYSQASARRFDEILAAAEARGIHIQMCLFSFNELSLRGFSNWESNPYRDIHGGPISTPKEFFSNAECRASIRKLLRYIVARWGYSTSVLCWQLFNEFNMITLTDFATPGDWHSEMAAHIKSLDPFGHPVTTSLTNQLSGGLWSPSFWQRPELDIVCEHRYSSDYPASQVRLADAGTHLGKPTLVGEVGTDPSGWYDTNGTAMRRMAWATALRLSGSMYWWWQSIDAVNTYHVYRPLVAFREGEDWGARGLQLTDFSFSGAPSGLRAYGIQSAHRAYAYIVAPDESPSVDGMVLQGLRLAPGDYRIEFWRTTSPGGLLSSRTASSDGYQLDVPVPAFVGDTAVKIVPLTPEPTVTPAGTGPTGTPTATPPSVPGVLISQGKPAFADSVFGPGFEAGKANDGISDREDSRWVSGPEGKHWWYVDLEGLYALSNVDLYGEQSAGQGTVFNVSSYNIRASATGTGSLLNWDLIGSFYDICGSPYPSYDPNSTIVRGLYRYVGLEIVHNDGTCGPYARVLEVQVFGNTPTPPVPPATPTPRNDGLIVFY